MKGSIKSQLGYIWKQIDGINVSKKDIREISSIKDITGNRSVSDKVHSFAYKDEIFKTGKQLGEFAREEFGIKDFEKIDGKIVESFIEQKISDGISKGTLDNYIAHIAKIGVGLEKIAQEQGKEYQAFTKEDLSSVKEFVRDLTPNEHTNRAYENPNALISNLENKEFLAAKLQLEYGLRITEATYIKENQLNGNTLTFQGKGGYILQKELTQELANQIKEHMNENGVFRVNQNQFREHLKDACRIEGEKYNGAHGLRYNFAQKTFIERFDNNVKNGMSIEDAEKEALKYTSEEMGHHREEITLHYLG